MIDTPASTDGRGPVALPPGLFRRWRGLALPAGVAVAQVVFSLVAEQHRAGFHVDAVGWALLLVGPAALLARHRWPVTVMWVSFAAADLPHAPHFCYLSLIVTFVLVVVGGHRWAAAAMLAAGYVGSLWLVPLVRGEPTATLQQALLLGGWLAVLAGAGEIVRSRRDHAAAHREARAAEAGRQRSEERLQMARDLHDIVGHNIALISVQAGAGLDLFDRDPEQARRSLAAIRAVAGEALDELRAVLAALRREGDAPPHTPTPGVDRLPDLVATTRAAGLPVRLQTDGTPCPLPVGVDLAAYRIVQESLTNVARHAGRTVSATVRLDYRPDRLLVRVHDDGAVAARPAASRAPAAAGPVGASGTGIGGMRERAAALGGRLSAGPDPRGGFTVDAELPLDVLK